MAMVPHERSLVERMQDKPFVLLGVNEDDSMGALQATVQDESMSWRSLWDADGAILRQWDPEGGLPYIVLIDHKGEIRQIIPGRPRDESVLDKAIDKLVAEAEREGG
jgi:hypothetical protein